MLDWKPHGDNWSQRPASASYEDASAVRDSMVGYSRLLEHLGLNPRFLTPGMIKHGKLRNHDYRVLILPHVISLGNAEAGEIRDFIKHGGVVIADVQPGLFDEHSRKLSKPPLTDLFWEVVGAARPPRREKEGTIYLDPNVVGCSQSMENESCRGTLERLGYILSESSIKPLASITERNGKPVTDCELYFFRKGAATIIALQRDEMKPPPTGAGDRADDPSAGNTVVLTLRRPTFAYDLRAKHTLGRTDHFELVLDPFEPTLLSTSATSTRP
jgi:hypothetical protein